MALYVQACNVLANAEDTIEICGAQVLGQFPLDVINIYRTLIRATEEDRQDRFDPRRLLDGVRTILFGDVNGYHPAWDDSCEEVDSVGERLADRMEDIGWTPLNSGATKFMSYRSGSQTDPDLTTRSVDLTTTAH